MYEHYLDSVSNGLKTTTQRKAILVGLITVSIMGLTTWNSEIPKWKLEHQSQFKLQSNQLITTSETGVTTSNSEYPNWKSEHQSQLKSQGFKQTLTTAGTGVTTSNSEYPNWKPEHQSQLKSQYIQTITMSWVFDRSIPQEILSNIQDIHGKYPAIPIQIYCGTSRCIEGIRSINNTNISATFLQVKNIVRGTPLQIGSLVIP